MVLNLRRCVVDIKGDLSYLLQHVDGVGGGEKR